MHHKRHRPKNARSGCLMCKPWKANGASKTRPEDVNTQSPGQHPGVCKGPDGWHDSHDWGAPFYRAYDRETHEHYRSCNPTTFPRSRFVWWEHECLRCGKVEQVPEGRSTYTVGHPYGIPAI
jgi:hypothetical protein